MQGMGVLVVDDDLEILRLATSFLEREGMMVLSASSGEEAIRMVRENRIDLTITDFHMPGMKGIELACRIREIVPDMLILMITGDVSEETCSVARKAGIREVFAKPLCFCELVHVARGIIRERNARAGVE